MAKNVLRDIIGVATEWHYNGSLGQRNYLDGRKEAQALVREQD